MAKKSSKSSKKGKQTKQLTEAQKEKNERKAKERAKREAAEKQAAEDKQAAEVTKQAAIKRHKKAGEIFVKELERELPRLSSLKEKEDYLGPQLLEQLKAKKIIAWQQGLLHVMTLECADLQAKVNMVHGLLLEACSKALSFFGKSLAVEDIRFKDCAKEVASQARATFPEYAQKFKQAFDDLERFAKRNKDSSYVFCLDIYDPKLRLKDGRYCDFSFEEDRKYYRYFLSASQIKALENALKSSVKRFLFVSIRPAYVFDQEDNTVKLAREYFESLQTCSEIKLPTVFSACRDQTYFDLTPVSDDDLFGSKSKWISCSVEKISLEQIIPIDRPVGVELSGELQVAQVNVEVQEAITRLKGLGLNSLFNVTEINDLLGNTFISPLKAQLEQLTTLLEKTQDYARQSDVASASSISPDELHDQQEAVGIAWEKGVKAVNVATEAMFRLKACPAEYLCALHQRNRAEDIRGVVKEFIKGIAACAEELLRHKESFGRLFEQIQGSSSEGRPVELMDFDELTLKMLKLPDEFIAALEDQDIEKWNDSFLKFCEHYYSDFPELLTALVKSIAVAARHFSSDKLEEFRGQADPQRLFNFFEEKDRHFYEKKLNSEAYFFENYARSCDQGFLMPVFKDELKKIIHAPFQLNYGMCRDRAFHGLLPRNIFQLFSQETQYELCPVEKCYWLDENDQFNISSSYLRDMYRLYSSQKCLFFRLGEVEYSISIDQASDKLKGQEDKKGAPVQLEVDRLEQAGSYELTGSVSNFNYFNDYLLKKGVFAQDASDVKIGRSSSDATRRDQHAKANEEPPKASPLLVKKETAEEKAARLKEEKALEESLKERNRQEAMKSAQKTLKELGKILPEGEAEFIGDGEQQAKIFLKTLEGLLKNFKFNENVEKQCRKAQDRYDQCRCNKHADSAVGYLRGDQGKKLNKSHYESAVEQARLCFGVFRGVAVKGNSLDLTASNAFLALETLLASNIYPKYEKAILGLLPHVIAYFCQKDSFQKAHEFCSTLVAAENIWDNLKRAVEAQVLNIQEISKKKVREKSVSELKERIGGLEKNLLAGNVGNLEEIAELLVVIRQQLANLKVGYSLVGRIAKLEELFAEKFTMRLNDFIAQLRCAPMESPKLLLVKIAFSEFLDGFDGTCLSDLQQSLIAESRKAIKGKAYYGGEKLIDMAQQMEQRELAALDKALEVFLTEPQSCSSSDYVVALHDISNYFAKHIYVEKHDVSHDPGKHRHVAGIKQTKPSLMLFYLVQWCEDYFDSHQEFVLKLMGAILTLSKRSPGYAKSVGKQLLKLKGKVKDLRFGNWARELLPPELFAQLRNATWYDFFDEKEAILADHLKPGSSIFREKELKALSHSLMSSQAEMNVALYLASWSPAHHAQQFFEKISSKIRLLLRTIITFSNQLRGEEALVSVGLLNEMREILSAYITTLDVALYGHDNKAVTSAPKPRLKTPVQRNEQPKAVKDTGSVACLSQSQEVLPNDKPAFKAVISTPKPPLKTPLERSEQSSWASVTRLSEGREMPPSDKLRFGAANKAAHKEKKTSPAGDHMSVRPRRIVHAPSKIPFFKAMLDVSPLADLSDKRSFNQWLSCIVKEAKEGLEVTTRAVGDIKVSSIGSHRGLPLVEMSTSLNKRDLDRTLKLGGRHLGIEGIRLSFLDENSETVVLPGIAYEFKVAKNGSINFLVVLNKADVRCLQSKMSAELSLSIYFTGGLVPDCRRYMAVLRAMSGDMPFANQILSGEASSWLKIKGVQLFADLNERQSCVVRTIFKGEPGLYPVIGPPGTGKTRMIAVLVAEWLSRSADQSGNKRVLLCAPSHEAAKVLERAISEVLENAGQQEWASSVFRLEKFHAENTLERRRLKNATVIISTLTGSGSQPLPDELHGKVVDLLIIDEVCQAVPPDCLIPLMYCSPQQLLVVGDPCQLGPLINDKAVRRVGYREHPVFSDRARQALMLNTQYRMHPAICGFPSKQFYGAELHSSQGLKERISPLQRASNVKFRTLPPCTFFSIKGQEKRDSSGSVSNAAEAKFIARFLEHLLLQLTSGSSVLVLTFYAEQVSKLCEIISNHNSDVLDYVNVDTVDSSQGGEADVVVISCVRAAESAGFLDDNSRVNVALTRAKSRLFVVGDRHALKKLDTSLKPMLEHYDQQDDKQCQVIERPDEYLGLR